MDKSFWFVENRKLRYTVKAPKVGSLLFLAQEWIGSLFPVKDLMEGWTTFSNRKKVKTV